MQERQHKPTTDDTVEVEARALDEVLESALGRLNFASEEDEREVEAVRQLYADRYDIHLCELCLLPHEAGYRTVPGGLPVCGTHADALESEDWGEIAKEVEAIEPLDPVEDEESMARRRICELTEMDEHETVKSVQEAWCNETNKSAREFYRHWKAIRDQGEVSG